MKSLDQYIMILHTFVSTGPKLNTTFEIKPPLSSCIKSGTAAMEKQVFEYGLMLASANPNSGTVGPSPLEKYRVSEIFNDLPSI